MIMLRIIFFYVNCLYIEVDNLSLGWYVEIIFLRIKRVFKNELFLVMILRSMYWFFFGIVVFLVYEDIIRE